MKNLQFIFFVALLVAGFTGAARHSERSKQARARLFDTCLTRGQSEVAQGILWDLIGDYPDDADILTLIDRIDQPIQNAKTLRAANIVSIQTQLRQLVLANTRVEVSPEPALNREQTFDADYLYRLFKEQRITEGRLSVASILDATLAAEAALENREYQRARIESQRALRSDPGNHRAAAVWCCASVLLTPEAVDNPRIILPVAEHIATFQPDNYPALLASGIIHQISGNFLLSDDRLRKAIESRPDLPEPIIARIATLYASGRDTEALHAALGLWRKGPKTDSSALTVWRCFPPDSVQDKQAFLEEWKTALPGSALPDKLADASAESERRQR